MEANLETLLSPQHYQLSDEIIQQIKTAVREAVTETIEAKMEVWMLKKDYDHILRMQAAQEAILKFGRDAHDT